MLMVCRKKWNKIKKSSLSSKLKDVPHNGHESNDILLKPKESSTTMDLSSGGLCMSICVTH